MYIIFKNLFGGYRMTTEENFKSRIWDERKISNFDGFTTAEQVIDYCVKYFGGSANDYKVFEEEDM